LGAVLQFAAGSTRNLDVLRGFLTRAQAARSVRSHHTISVALGSVTDLVFDIKLRIVLDSVAQAETILAKLVSVADTLLAVPLTEEAKVGLAETSGLVFATLVQLLDALATIAIAIILTAVLDLRENAHAIGAATVLRAGVVIVTLVIGAALVAVTWYNTGFSFSTRSTAEGDVV
jgi:hypothetical protein